MTDTPITWGTDNLLVVDWARAAITDNTFPAAANLRVVPDADGAKFVWDAFQATLNWTDGFYLTAASGDAMCSAKFSVPVGLVAAHSPLPNDDRTFRSGGAATAAAGVLAGGAVGSSIYAELVADGLTPYRFASLTASPSGAISLVPAQPSNMTAFRARLEGVNTKLVGGLLKTSYAGSGVAAPNLAPGTYVSGDVLPTGQAGGTNAAKSTVLSWPAGELRLHDIGLFMQEAPAAVPPPAMGAVMYRDRADGGKFKPLAELNARGYPAQPCPPCPDCPPAGIDPATAKIVWGTENLIAPNYAGARVAMTVGSIPNLRVTPVADGVRIQADAWHFDTGSTPTGNIEIPLTWDKLTALPGDERALRPTAVLDNVGAGGIISIGINLASDTMPSGGAGFNLTAGATTTGNNIQMNNSPGKTTDRAPLMATLAGANPRLIYKLQYMAFGPTDFPAMDVTVRNISVVAQAVAAP